MVKHGRITHSENVHDYKDLGGSSFLTGKKIKWGKVNGLRKLNHITHLDINKDSRLKKARRN